MTLCEKAVSSSRREPADLAALYAQKASNDATAARQFADNPETSTHALDQLFRLLEQQGSRALGPGSDGRLGR
jgi:hypothetical protein